MAVSRVRSVERSPVGWLSYPLPVALVAWLSNDVPACRGSRRGVAHKRGASAKRDPWNWACPPRSLPQVKDREEGVVMVAAMIGIDPHKASHTAVAIDPAEVPLGQLQVRACAAQAERLLGWAQAWPQRTWAVEGAGGVGHLLAQQLLSAGERVLDVPPKLAARVRLLATGNINKRSQRRPVGGRRGAALRRGRAGPA